MKKKLKIFDLLIKEKFNRKWCAWAYGMNMFDLTGSDMGGVHRTKSATAKIGLQAEEVLPQMTVLSIEEIEKQSIDADIKKIRCGYHGLSEVIESKI